MQQGEQQNSSYAKFSSQKCVDPAALEFRYKNVQSFATSELYGRAEEGDLQLITVKMRIENPYKLRSLTTIIIVSI